MCSHGIAVNGTVRGQERALVGGAQRWRMPGPWPVCAGGNSVGPAGSEILDLIDGGKRPISCLIRDGTD